MYNGDHALKYDDLMKILAKCGQNITYVDYFNQTVQKKVKYPQIKINNKDLRKLSDYVWWCQILRAAGELDFTKVLFFMNASYLPINNATVVDWRGIYKILQEKVEDIYDENGNFRKELNSAEIVEYVNNFTPDDQYELKEFMEKYSSTIKYNSDIVKLYYRKDE